MVELFLVSIIMLGPNIEYQFYQYNHIQAVPFNQPITNNRIKVGIVKMVPFSPSEITVGEYVVAPSRINEQYLWVHQVIDIDEINSTLTLSVNNLLVTEVYTFSEIKGTFISEATGLDVILFMSTEPWIYFLNIGTGLSITTLLILWIIHSNKKTLNSH